MTAAQRFGSLRLMRDWVSATAIHARWDFSSATFAGGAHFPASASSRADAAWASCESSWSCAGFSRPGFVSSTQKESTALPATCSQAAEGGGEVPRVGAFTVPQQRSQLGVFFQKLLDLGGHERDPECRISGNNRGDL